MKITNSRLCVWVLVAFSTTAFTNHGKALAQEPGTVIAADKRVQGRSYLFPETGENIQYALFVPSNYETAKKWPLIVGLHGAGRPHDWLMGYEGIVDFAQRDGFIMVTPLGYRSLGGFGGPLRTPLLPANPPPGRTSAQTQALEKEARSLPANIRELSEKDVMHVLQIVRKEFNIDPNRIYAWGHSMGGGGAFHLAAKYPDIWAAVAVAAPWLVVSLDELEPVKQTPILVLQGDADQNVPAEGTRDSVSKMKQLGMQYVYVEIKGGDHSLFISKDRDTLSKIFSFFNIVHKNERMP